jgi:hypothetical protein
MDCNGSSFKGADSPAQGVRLAPPDFFLTEPVSTLPAPSEFVRVYSPSAHLGLTETGGCLRVFPFAFLRQYRHRRNFRTVAACKILNFVGWKPGEFTSGGHGNLVA